MITDPDLYSSDLHTIKRKKINDIVRIVLFASTILSVIILCILIMNILNNAFGPVAVENTVDPASLTQDGVTLEELNADQLISLLEEHLSTGLIRRYNSEEPLSDRSRGDLLDLVNERIVKSAVVQSWSLGDAILRGDEIDAYFLNNPGQERQFRSRGPFTWNFLYVHEN